MTFETWSARSDPEWEALVDRSPDALLFHRLSFLSYHPADRFREHRWKARQAGELVAAITLAEFPLPPSSGGQEGMELRSPYGGSFGGFVTAPGLTSADHELLVAGAKEMARDGGARLLHIAVPPSPYRSQGDHAEFALFAQGARVTAQEITHAVSLQGSEDEVWSRIHGAGRRGARKAERLGTTVRAGTAQDLPEFHRLTAANIAAKGRRPTHSLAELQDLFRRFPESMILHVAENDGRVVGGILVFRCNARVALSFYTARAEGADANRCMDLLSERTILDSMDRGFEWLDLGTTSIGGVMNPGLEVFKEGLGGIPFVRRTWSIHL
ncbi:MAG TPA: GNAT family N-acetyltransferase [bacterium]|nr:GNAT family N-acetyltransferase [bacterium]